MEKPVLLNTSNFEPRWVDFDMYNHLTSSKYIDISIEARYLFFKTEIQYVPNLQIITKSINIDYKKPIYFSETINLKLYLAELSSFSFIFHTHFCVNNNINALVITKLVTMENGKIVKIPDHFIENFKRLEHENTSNN